MPYGFLLDEVGSATSAFAFRKLRAAYAGSAFRGRLSAGTEQDIGFRSDGTIDMSALLSFAAGGDVYLKTWYDQSGNGKDLTISSFSNTCVFKVVSAGVPVTDIYGNLWAQGPGTVGSATNFIPAHATGHPTTDHTILIYAATQTDISQNTGQLYSTANERFEISNVGTAGARIFKNGGSNSTIGSAICMPNQPQYIQSTTNLSTNRLNQWQNGQITLRNKSITGYTPDANLRLGFNSGSFQANFYGYIGELVTYASVLSDSDLTKAWGVHKQYRTTLNSNPSMPYIIADGDSLTNGDSTTLQNYSRQLNALLSSTRGYQFYDSGVGGDRIIELISEAVTADTGIDAITYLEPSPFRILIAWAGTNQLVQLAHDQNTTYQSTLEYVAGRRAAGNFDAIVWMTTLPRLDSTTTAEIQAYNALLRTGMTRNGTLRAAGCSALIDLDEISVFKGNGAYLNRDYFGTDSIHINPAGQALVAAKIKSALHLA